jgi:hypothetical protein
LFSIFSSASSGVHLGDLAQGQDHLPSVIVGVVYVQRILLQIDGIQFGQASQLVHFGPVGDFVVVYLEERILLQNKLIYINLFNFFINFMYFKYFYIIFFIRF